ncbi:MAG: hypothetical protein QXX35_03495 [Desulfurococcaceae archaeon]|uniref:Uncharacterized protein n=1 Tax=Staphylothermus marinus TaxID=2280 RepID=A0A7C4D9W7_STAMA
MNIDDRFLEMITRFVKENKDKLFDLKPGEVVEKVMENIRKHGLAAKFFIRMNWSKIESVFQNPEQILESLKNYDKETYEIVIKHIDWFKEFLNILHNELRVFIEK